MGPRITTLAVTALLALGTPLALGQVRTPDPVRKAQRKNIDLLNNAEVVVGALEVVAGAKVATFGMDQPGLLREVAKRLGPEGQLFTVHRQESYYDFMAEQLLPDFGRRIRPVFTADGDAHLPSDSVDIVLLIDRQGFFRNPVFLYDQAATILRPGGRMVVLRDPTMSGQTVDPRHPGPELREMLSLEKLGFRFEEAVEGLHTRQIWVFEYAGAPEG